MKSLPDARLRSAAELVRQDAVFADIGTDHAYLPLFLLETGRIARAVAADIGKGPLENARRTVGAAGVSDRVTLLLTDGLRGVETYGVTDIAICGMGGEMIEKIISDAPFVKDGKISLILGPMTKQESLVTYLAENGFAVDRAVYSCSECKYYVTYLAHFTGETKKIALADAVAGPKNSREMTPEYIGYLTKKERAYARAAAGKRQGAEDATAEEAVLAALRDVLGNGERS